MWINGTYAVVEGVSLCPLENAEDSEDALERGADYVFTVESGKIVNEMGKREALLSLGISSLSFPERV